MCIVVDINTLAPVFNKNCEGHVDFGPVREWVERGQGFVVFGGSRYKRELRKSFRYLRLIRQMKESGQAVAIRDDAVDAAETDVVALTKGTCCDDQYIVALLGISRCPLFCSQDTGSYEFIRNRALYPKRMPRVRIYSSRSNLELLRPMSTAMLKNRA